jgi:hypothetical protein
MKFVLTFLGFFICLTHTRAQETEVLTIPAAVSDLFTLLYPDAKSIEWQITGDRYKAEFKNNKMETMALIDAEGTLLQTCTEIKITALPEAALSLLADRFAEEKIDQAMITENAKGVITFTAIIDKVDYTFDTAGQLMASHAVVLTAQEKAQ